MSVSNLDVVPEEAVGAAMDICDDQTEVEQFVDEEEVRARDRRALHRKFTKFTKFTESSRKFTRKFTESSQVHKVHTKFTQSSQDSRKFNMGSRHT